MDDAMQLLLLGTNEAEACYGGEAELHQQLICCSKNPGHDTFVPVGELTLADLPPNYRDRDLFELIKVMSDITVRVAVNVTSPTRPQFYPGTTHPYPFFEAIGKTMLRTGTGRIWDTRKMTEEDDLPCPCAVCKTSATPTKTWGQINVITATHVIFDDIEARHSITRWGYDAKDSAFVEFEGVDKLGSDVMEDRYLLTCATHDLPLVDHIRGLVDRYNDLCFLVYKKFLRSKDRDRLTVIVSHPHGCTKQVSVGQWTRKYEVGRGNTKYSYTACTCPGSSGAPLYTLGRAGWRWMYSHVHSGAGVSGNFSGLGWEH